MVAARVPELAPTGWRPHVDPVTAPRLEIDLDLVEHNTRVLVDRLAARGIRVTGVTKATLGSPRVAAAMLRGGAVGLGDSRVENLARLGDGDRQRHAP